MKRNDSEQLLDDVLGDAAPADFRATLLDATLRQVRRRKRTRRWHQGLAVAACLTLVSFACWKMFWPASRTIEPRAPALIVVHSRPLDRSMIVETNPRTVNTVVSSSSTFALVETGTAKGLFQEIDDEGLLALLAGKPVALVRRGPHQVELIFLNPEDEKGFPVE